MFNYETVVSEANRTVTSLHKRMFTRGVNNVKVFLGGMTWVFVLPVSRLRVLVSFAV